MITPELIETLRNGGVAVIRTDTIYGVIGLASSRDTVERIYKIKGRNPSKSPIVLIGSSEAMFDNYDAKTLEDLKKYWPGPNSIILPSDNGPEWLTRGNHSIAYRLPDDEQIKELASLIGPLIAPSANPEGFPPAMNIEEAKRYFDSKIDIYVDGGTVTDPKASSLYLYDSGNFVKLR